MTTFLSGLICGSIFGFIWFAIIASSKSKNSYDDDNLNNKCPYKIDNDDD